MLNVSRPNINTGRTATVLIVLGGLVAIYLLINKFLSHIFSGFVAAYVAQPVLWFCLAVLVWLLPRYRTAAKLRLHPSILIIALGIGFLQILFSIMAGLLSGFGHSPYSFTPESIITNVSFVGTALVGIELSRASLIGHLSRRRTLLVLWLAAFLFTLLDIPLMKLTGLHGGKATVEFLGSTAFPLLAQNLFACYLAYLAGPFPAIGYRGMLLAFEWFSPVLPDLPWALTALVGTVTPAVGFMAVQSFHASQIRPRLPKRYARENGSPVKLTIMAVGVVSIIWFSIGILPLYPSTVITGSMTPSVNVGDLIIVSKVPVDSIKTGDIIEYRTTDKSIMHRVIEVEKTGGSLQFITKGDANSAPDEAAISAQQVKGKVILKIPKLGWASIKIKSLLGLN